MMASSFTTAAIDHPVGHGGRRPAAARAQWRPCRPPFPIGVHGPRRMARRATSSSDDDGMTLVEERASDFGTLQVFRAADDYRDASFAGATLLMRAHTPDAVLSEYRVGADGSGDEVTGGVFDLFATLPPLLSESEADADDPIVILGLGAGTCARLLAALYPHEKRRVVGWELDPIIVDLARIHFGMSELEASGRLTVRCGDAFEGIRQAAAGGGRCAGVIVDIFDEQSRVPPSLAQMKTWHNIAAALVPGGRVIANISTGRGKGASMELAVAAAEAAAITCGGGEACLWRSGAQGIWNEVVLTGPPPPAEWADRLPPKLRHLTGDWHHVKAPPGVEHGWLMES